MRSSLFLLFFAAERFFQTLFSAMLRNDPVYLFPQRKDELRLCGVMGEGEVVSGGIVDHFYDRVPADVPFAKLKRGNVGKGFAENVLTERLKRSSVGDG